MRSYDVAIVGGGPAGLSAAYSASKNGATVILFERDKSIAHNIRTSGVSWIDSMKKLEIPEKLYNPIKNYRFVSPNNDILIKGFDYRSCVIDVRGLYQYLAFLAANSGSEIWINSNVTHVSVPNDKGGMNALTVNTPKGTIEFKCKLIIDASGFNGFVSRKLGDFSGWKRFGIGAAYECYCENLDPETWSLMVGKQYSPAGYAWAFPLSRNRIRIGVGIGRPESTQEPLKLLNQMIENKLKPLNELGWIEPVEFHYGYIPNQGTRDCTVYDRVLLVGDSAGQSNPLVLEGIRHAIEFGRLAGKIGSESLVQEDPFKYLIKYEKEWRKLIGTKIQSALKVQSRWINLSDDQWDEELDILKEMSMDEFLDFIKADFTTAKMIKLAINHPKVMARQLFNLVLKK